METQDIPDGTLPAEGVCVDSGPLRSRHQNRNRCIRDLLSEKGQELQEAGGVFRPPCYLCGREKEEGFFKKSLGLHHSAGKHWQGQWGVLEPVACQRSPASCRKEPALYPCCVQCLWQAACEKWDPRAKALVHSEHHSWISLQLSSSRPHGA